MKQVLILFMVLFLACLYSQELKVSPERHNFGRFMANTEKKHSFTLSNTGDKELAIDKIRSTCGCATADSEKKNLKPGETTSVEIKILKESIAGPFSKGIFIHSNSVSKKIMMITVSGEAVPLVTVLPQNNIYMGTLETGKEFKQEFLFNTGQKVEFMTPETEGNIEPSISLVRISETQTKLTFTWKPVKENDNVKCKVSIGIKAPENWKPVELNLHGTVKG